MLPTKNVKNAEQTVMDALHQFQYTYQTLRVDKKNKLVSQNQITPHRVGLLSGGGCMHDPFAIGFVGDGMLSAAIAGLNFSSSPAHTIFKAICTISQRNKNFGLLVIIMNYTEDILNFEKAVEEAKSFNINVELIIIDERCSINDANSDTSFKGICGNCFVFKIAGSMARCGKNLAEIFDECHIINESTYTSILPVLSYFSGEICTFFKINDLDTTKVDRSMKYKNNLTKVQSYDEHIYSIIRKIIEILSLSSNDEVCVIINCLGPISQLKLGSLSFKIYNILTDLKITVCRMYCGPLITSFSEASFQISILNISKHPEWLMYLDESTNAPNWPLTCISIPQHTTKEEPTGKNEKHYHKQKVVKNSSYKEAIIFKQYLVSFIDILIKKKKLFQSSVFFLK